MFYLIIAYRLCVVEHRMSGIASPPRLDMTALNYTSYKRENTKQYLKQQFADMKTHRFILR